MINKGGFKYYFDADGRRQDKLDRRVVGREVDLPLSAAEDLASSIATVFLFGRTVVIHKISHSGQTSQIVDVTQENISHAEVLGTPGDDGNVAR